MKNLSHADLQRSIMLFMYFMIAVIPGEVRIDPTPSNNQSRGDNVTLTCSASGGPDNSFQWQKDGADLSGENQSILQLTLIDATDGGEYTCVVSNAAGNDSTNVILYIQPYITVDPQSQILTAVGSSVTFTCEALGFPTPSYRWDKEGDPEFNTPTTYARFEQNLTFNPVSFGNEGYYTCVAVVIIEMANYTAESTQALLISKSRVFISSYLLTPVH